MRPAELHVELRALNFADIFCIDEAHRLCRDSQETLYRALDERLIPTSGRDGQGRRQEESIADFCLVLATNFPGEIQKALRNRTTSISFESYSERELTEIARSVAIKQGMQITPQALGWIAEAAQGSPRRIQMRLKSLELFAPNVAEYNVDDVRDLLTAEGLDCHNLTPLQRNYLRCPAALPRYRATLNQLSSKLGIDIRFIRDEIEPYLIEKGYVVVQSNNVRALTDCGRQLLQELEVQ